MGIRRALGRTKFQGFSTNQEYYIDNSPSSLPVQSVACQSKNIYFSSHNYSQQMDANNKTIEVRGIHHSMYHASYNTMYHTSIRPNSPSCLRQCSFWVDLPCTACILWCTYIRENKRLKLMCIMVMSKSLIVL